MWVLVPHRLFFIGFTGKKDGATQMVKNGTAVEAHQWSESEQKWTKIGDVVGSTDSNHTRTLFEGKVCVYRWIRGSGDGGVAKN